MSERLEDDKAYIRLFNQNTKLSKRVKELESHITKMAIARYKDSEELDETHKQNKRYREALEWIKELSEHNEYEDTLNQILLKAVEALEGEINDSERINKRTREI